MLIKTYIVLATHTGGRIKRGDPVHVGIYACDHCEKQFEKRASQMIGKSHHFCSKPCRNAECKRSGKIGVARTKTCLERYGVQNTFQSPELQARIRLTVKERYAVDHIMHLSSVREKISKANVIRWNMMTNETLRTMQRKKKVTCMRLYGVEHPMKSAHIRQRATQSMIDHGFLRSKAERFLESMLVSLFGRHDVMTQVWQNNVAGRNHPVDLYVSSLKLMIEYDGYWHCREDIKERDEEFNAWCIVQKRKLLRVSETELAIILERTASRLPKKTKQLEELATNKALSNLRRTVMLAAASDQRVMHANDYTITMPPTTAASVKLEPNV